MSKTLYVPDHIAKKAKHKKEAVASAYINQKDKVLDPSLLDLSLSERLPQPTGWRMPMSLKLDHWRIRMKVSLGRIVSHGAKKVSGSVLADMLALVSRLTGEKSV